MDKYKAHSYKLTTYLLLCLLGIIHVCTLPSGYSSFNIGVWFQWPQARQWWTIFIQHNTNIDDFGFWETCHYKVREIYTCFNTWFILYQLPNTSAKCPGTVFSQSLAIMMLSLLHPRPNYLYIYKQIHWKVSLYNRANWQAIIMDMQQLEHDMYMLLHAAISAHLRRQIRRGTCRLYRQAKQLNSSADLYSSQTFYPKGHKWISSINRTSCSNIILPPPDHDGHCK